MELFKPEVYKKMEEKLEEPSNHCGIEEALDMIREDEKLQKFLKEYAIKNGIRKNYHSYYVGQKEILIDLIKTGDEKYYRKISLGLDKDEDIMPILLNRRESRYGYDSRDSGSYNYDEVIISKIVKTDNGYLIKKPNSTSKEEYDTKRIIDIGLFDQFTKKDILDGLEKAVNKLIEGGKNE